MTNPPPFPAAALAPTGAHALSDESGRTDPRVVDEVDLAALADYAVTRHELDADLAETFAEWLDTLVADLGRTDTEYTWAALVSLALHLWRGGPDVVVLAALADGHPDPDAYGDRFQDSPLALASVDPDVSGWVTEHTDDGDDVRVGPLSTDPADRVGDGVRSRRYVVQRWASWPL